MFCKGNLINSIEIRMKKMLKMDLMMFAVKVLLPGIMWWEAAEECPSDPNLFSSQRYALSFNLKHFSISDELESILLNHVISFRPRLVWLEETLMNHRLALWPNRSRIQCRSVFNHELIRYTLQRRIASPTQLGRNETKCRQQYHLQASKDYPNLQSNIKIIWNPPLMIFSRSHLNE